MTRFAHPELLWLLALVPGLLLLFWLRARARRRTLAALGEHALVQRLMPRHSMGRERLKRTLQAVVLGLLILAAADPQIGNKVEDVKRQGFEIMVCLDVSNSMLATDLEPNRLERAKLNISKLVDRLRNDRVGIIVFAGDAYVQLPLTIDHAAAKLFLRTIDTDIVPAQGTAIGKAIELAQRSFSPETKSDRAIIIISDGENHDEDALQAATSAGESGIIIHTVGIGSTEGTPLPEYRNGQMVGYRKDREGHTVVSKLNETILQQIAASANGTYVQANASGNALDLLLDRLEEMQREEFGSTMFTSYEDRFQYLLAAALIILLLEFITPTRKTILFRNVDLFGTKKK
jgi:Ca-activated chloride channel family protein